ncbi:hypothetical protein ACIBO5_45750 [Nonomuraea angiospora]|uniref:hypothetical protein n=1 Tax=Nonomuraea angiospora TaxID=46172 RepID=UPI0037BD00DF
MTTQPRDLVRPRMRTDMAFLETPDGMYVRGRGDGFFIRGAGAYRYLSALLPHLDGTTRLSDLLAGIPKAQAASVRSLITTLASRGVVTDAPESGVVLEPELRERFSGQIALLEHHGDDGSGFLRAAAARVLVVCDEPGQAGALAGALIANGIGSARGGWVRTAGASSAATVVVGSASRTVNGDSAALAVGDADVICLVAADRPSPELFGLAERARAAGVAFVSLVRVGDRLVLGPWQPGGSTVATVRSAMLRMSDNAVPGSGDMWLAAGGGSSAVAAPAVLPSAAATIAVSVTGFEIFKLLTGRIPSDLEDSVVIVDPDRLTIHVEPLIPHPAATRAPLAGLGGDGRAFGAEGQASSDEAYQRFKQVVADHVGIMRRFEDDDVSQIPVKISALIAPSADPDPIVAFGTGTLIEARLSALEEASLRYAVNLHRRCPGLLPPAPEDAEVVAAERVRSRLGGAPLPGDSLVAGIDLSALVSIDGAAAISEGTVTLGLPRSAVLTGPWDRRAARFEPDLVGVAAGLSLRAAVSRALLSAVGAYTVAAIAGDEVRVTIVNDFAATGERTGEGTGPGAGVSDGTGPDEGAGPSRGAGDGDPQRLDRVAMLVREAREDGCRITFYQAHGVAPVAIVRVIGAAGDELVVRQGRSWLEAAESALLAIVGTRRLASSPTGWTATCPPAAPVLTGFTLSPDESSDPAGTIDDETLIARLRRAGLRAGAVVLTPPDLVGVTNVVRVLLFREERR